MAAMVTEDKVTKVTAAESMAVTVTTEEETTEEEEEVITGAEVTHIAGEPFLNLLSSEE